MNEDILQRLIEECGQRLIRRVIEQDDWAAEAIFDIAAGDKVNWTPIEWAAVLCDLERSPLKVNDWIEASKNG